MLATSYATYVRLECELEDTDIEFVVTWSKNGEPVDFSVPRYRMLTLS
jgi:hypothetical protein